MRYERKAFNVDISFFPNRSLPHLLVTNSEGPPLFRLSSRCGVTDKEETSSARAQIRPQRSRWNLVRYQSRSLFLKGPVCKTVVSRFLSMRHSCPSRGRQARVSRPPSSHFRQSYLLSPWKFRRNSSPWAPIDKMPFIDGRQTCTIAKKLAPPAEAQSEEVDSQTTQARAQSNNAEVRRRRG
ncbi:hypothetical protein BJY04DRAFT_177151 [Aspergillus karnatakaensis]|uniref:uncharacterized protein n=1 Tax=Aspergillus karnatakaensis TaxID=1810916 RepID=UPI003CCD0C61